mmetsp:Transcript_30355/g.75369  ORF Transcript_30355/g.75369 Transcript_30355/m.75369 type:complete len:218 (-) Transcript_30355:132-785(-)
MRWTSSKSLLRERSKSSWCCRIAASSSSSNTSIMDCSSVLATNTSKMGSTSRSKSNSSPSLIWVLTSTPILAGMKSGDGGRSSINSVCVRASNWMARSVISSKYLSVCTSMCCRPRGGSGVLCRTGAVPGPPVPACCALRSLRRCASRSFAIWTGSGCGAVMAAYVLPRITRLLNIRFLLVSSGSSLRYFFLGPTARGWAANCWAGASVAVCVMPPC